MTIKLLSGFIAIFIFLLVVELIRREKLTFKYAVGWFIVSLAAIIVTVFDDILFKFARMLGFQLTSNFIFFALLAVFVLLALVLTVFLCQQDDRNKIIARKVALLENQIETLKKLFEDQKDGRS